MEAQRYPTDYDGLLVGHPANDWTPALDATDPNLAPLLDAGGKLLLHHGWSDADISPLGSIRCYERVIDALGRGGARAPSLVEVQTFFRLFMLPGVGHCRGGPGPDQFDGLTAFRAWVEDGVAPEILIASKLDGTRVVRTLPLCPYPAGPVYNGDDPSLASSYDCQSP